MAGRSSGQSTLSFQRPFGSSGSVLSLSTAIVVADPSAVAVPAKPKDESDEWRFLRFLELRRHEKKKIQQEQDMQRLAKMRKVGSEVDRKPVLALTADVSVKGRPGKVAPPPTLMKTPNRDWGRSTGADLDASIRQAMRDQQKNKAEERGRFSIALQLCISTDMTVAVAGMPKMVKLMEATALPHERIQLLQVLEKTAQLPDGSCWTRFVELKGTPVLRQWILGTANVSDGALEGESDKIVCGCLNVLTRLNMSFDRAQADGLVQTCQNIGSERPAYVRKLADELVRSWRPIEEEGEVVVEEADGSSSDSGSSSSTSGSGAAEAVLASALSKPAATSKTAATSKPAGTSSGARYEARKPAAASSGVPLQTRTQLDEKRKQEAETQRTLDNLLELGKLLDPGAREEDGAPDDLVSASSDEGAEAEPPRKQLRKTESTEDDRLGPSDAEVPIINAVETQSWNDPDEDSADESSAEQLVLGSDDGSSTDHG